MNEPRPPTQVPGPGDPSGPTAPASPRGLTLWEGLLPVALFSLSQPLVSVVASIWLAQRLPPGLSPREVEDALNRLVLPLLILVSHAVGWAALLWVYRWRRGEGLLRGLRLQNLQRFRVARIFGAGMGLHLVAMVLGVLLPQPETLDNPVLRFASYGRWAVLLLALLAGVMAPFLEESLFRGAMLSSLRRRMGFLPAALLVTVLFTALHAVQTDGYLPPLVAIFLLGFLLAWLREASGSLWPPVLMHMGYNSAVLLLLLVVGSDLEGVEPALAMWLPLAGLLR